MSLSLAFDDREIPNCAFEPYTYREHQSYGEIIKPAQCCGRVLWWFQSRAGQGLWHAERMPRPAAATPGHRLKQSVLRYFLYCVFEVGFIPAVFAIG